MLFAIKHVLTSDDSSDLTGLDKSGLDTKSTPYAEVAVELQGFNMAPD